MGFLSKAKSVGTWLGKAVQKGSSLVSKASGLVGDVANIASAFDPEFQVIADAASVIGNVATGVSQVSRGDIAGGFVTLAEENVTDLVSNAIPGASQVAAGKDLIKRFNTVNSNLGSKKINLNSLLA